MGKVFVAGSINMDVVVTAARHPRPGETVPGREVLFLPGGKGANQAVAAARLGAEAELIGCIGQDGFGAELRRFLGLQRVDLQHLRETGGAATGTAMITVAQADNTIVVVPGANAGVSPTDVEAPQYARGDVLVGQLEIPPGTVAAFFARGRAAGARTIFNPAPAIDIDRKLFAFADVMILNETELATYSGRKVDADTAIDELAAAARTLRKRADQIVCVTIGRRGALALIGDSAHRIEGREVDVVDTTGAGDCFTGAVAADLALGRPLLDAFAFANAAASLCVQRMGAGPSMPAREEVDAALA